MSREALTWKYGSDTPKSLGDTPEPLTNYLDVSLYFKMMKCFAAFYHACSTLTNQVARFEVSKSLIHLVRNRCLTYSLIHLVLIPFSYALPYKYA